MMAPCGEHRRPRYPATRCWVGSESRETTLHFRRNVRLFCHFLRLFCMVFSFGLISVHGRRGRRPSRSEKRKNELNVLFGRVRGPADWSEGSQRERPWGAWVQDSKVTIATKPCVYGGHRGPSLHIIRYRRQKNVTGTALCSGENPSPIIIALSQSLIPAEPSTGGHKMYSKCCLRLDVRVRRVR